MQSLLFIAGPPRSGTTLLSHLLNDPENTYPIFPECTYLTRVISLYHEILRYPDKTRYEAFIKDDVRLANLFRPTIDEMLRNAVSGLPQRKVLVLKDPELSKEICALKDVVSLPFKIVCCVRDPRDVMVSWLTVREKQEGVVNFEEEASKIYSYFHGLMNGMDMYGDNVLKIVRYEDVVIHSEFDQLTEFAGFKVGFVDRKASITGYDVSSPFYSEKYGKPVDAGSIGSYKKKLSDDEESYINAMFSGVMATFGYKVNG